jgi:hypothetical protein
MQHGSDHMHLGIAMAPWQTAFIFWVIVTAPPVAAALLWTRLQKTGLALLAASMAGSCFFGLWYHFVAGGADNVFTMKPGFSAAAFQVTAVLLAIIEGAGLFWSMRTLRTSHAERDSPVKRAAA